MSPSPARGHQGCGRPPTHLVDDPLHQVELPLQGGVKEKRQRVEADPQPVPRPLRVGLLQVGPFALSGGSFGFQGDPMEAGPGGRGEGRKPKAELHPQPRVVPGTPGQPALRPAQPGSRGCLCLRGRAAPWAPERGSKWGGGSQPSPTASALPAVRGSHLPLLLQHCPPSRALSRRFSFPLLPALLIPTWLPFLRAASGPQAGSLVRGHRPSCPG